MAERELLVRIVGDDRDLQRALKNTDRSTQQINNRMETFGKNVKTAFAAAGISFGTAAVFAGIRRAVSDASDLNEQITKNTAVFKQSSDGVLEWSKTTANAIGISQKAALGATGTFGNLFNTVGLLPAEAAGMSKALVELGADLASFNNADVDEVLLALRSGLIGEAEPLRRFGVLLSETRVQQEAMAETGKTNVKALTNQEKALARYNIILHDTIPAQGDFERTQGGLANQTRNLQANLTNLSAGLGSLLIPKLVETTQGFNDVATAIERIRGLADGGGEGGGRGGRVVSFLTQSLPAQFSDQADNLKRMARDIDLILQGKGFEKIKTPGSFKGVEELVTNVLKAFQESVNTAPIRIANGVNEIISQLDNAIAAALERTEKRELTKSRGAFSAAIKGLGLKFATAGLTESLTDDLAVLRETEARIQRQIKTEGRTFKLQEQLVGVRTQIQDKLAEIVSAGEARQTARAQEIEEKAQRSREAFEGIIDSLTLGLDAAQATKGLADDQKALRKIEAAILKRIEVEGRTTELLRRLLEVRQQQRDVANQLAEQRRERRQGDIFERLGLTREGEEKVPGGASLRKRASSLLDQIKGTALDTEKNRKILRGIVNTTNKDFRQAGRSLRNAVLGLLNDISGGLDDKKGPLTKTHGLATNQVIKNLGLTVEQAEEIQRRLAHATTGGAIARVAGKGATPSTGGLGGMPSFIVENKMTVNLDGQQIAAAITRQQQKTKRRNPKQKRGPNRR